MVIESDNTVPNKIIPHHPFKRGKNMRRIYVSKVFWLGLIICILLNCQGAMAQDTCLSALEDAHFLLDELRRQLPSRSEQVQKYQAIQSILSPCPKDQTPPHIAMEIKALKIAVKRKLECLLKQPTTYYAPCDTCKDQEPSASCLELCKQWETLYKDCYRMYYDNIDLFRRLTCSEAAEILNDYYDAAWHVLKEKRFDANTEYPPETIRMLWGLLYRMSRSDCVDHTEVKTAMRRIMFPYLAEIEKYIHILIELGKGGAPEQMEKLIKKLEMLSDEETAFFIDLLLAWILYMDPKGDYIQDLDPESIGRSLSVLIQTNPQVFVQLISSMEHLPSKERLRLISDFVEMTADKGDARATQQQKILSSLQNFDENQLDSALSILHKVPWGKINSAFKGIAQVTTQEAAIVHVYDFLLIDDDPTTDQDNEIAKTINDAFDREVPVAGYKLANLRTRKPNLSPDLLDKQINEKVQYPIRPKEAPKSFRPDIYLVGRIGRSMTGEYDLYIRFVSKQNVILFIDTIRVSPELKTCRDQLERKIKKLYEEFHLFIGMMSIIDKAESHVVIEYLKTDRPVAFINEAVHAHSQAYKIQGEKSWEKVGEIVVEPDFWGTDPAANKALGTGYREVIMQRLESLYYTSYHALVRDRVRISDRLEICGRYSEEVPSSLNTTNDKCSKITIVLKNKKEEEKSTTDLIISEQFIDKHQETVKAIIVQFVCGAIATTLNFNPEPLPKVTKVTALPELKYKFLTSFLMPGYVRSYHEEEPSGIVKAWNYSNIALLGLAVVSEAAYISTDYDNDPLFHIGVTATVGFIVNGVLGVVDAARYETPKKKNNTAGIAITGPYVSINGQYDEPTLMFTFKF